MSPRRATLALATATVAVSFSAIFICVAASDADRSRDCEWHSWQRSSLRGRPPGRARRSVIRPDIRVTVLVVVSGLSIAAHFLLWTALLAYTTVASSAVLVSLHPTRFAPTSQRILGDRLPPQMIVGIALRSPGRARRSSAGRVREARRSSATSSRSAGRSASPGI